MIMGAGRGVMGAGRGAGASEAGGVKNVRRRVAFPAAVAPSGGHSLELLVLGEAAGTACIPCI